MELRIDIPSAQLDTLRDVVFGGSTLAVGEERAVDHGIIVVNMTAGADNLIAPEVYTFLVENFDNIASGVVAAVVYDCFLRSGGFLYVNGKKIFTKQEIEEQIDDERKN